MYVGLKKTLKTSVYSLEMLIKHCWTKGWNNSLSEITFWKPLDVPFLTMKNEEIFWAFILSQQSFLAEVQIIYLPMKVVHLIRINIH